MRLIDLNDNAHVFCGEDGEYQKWNIDTSKTVDAEPVKHGRWTADESTYTEGFAQCSVCKTTYYVDDLYCVGEKAQSELPNYCPHCGAKMTDGEE